VFFRILFIAILNLALGYGLAWYLHGPRGMFAWPMPKWLKAWAGANPAIELRAESIAARQPIAPPSGIAKSDATSMPASLEPNLAPVDSARRIAAETVAAPEKRATTGLPAVSAELDLDYSPIMQAVANFRDDLTQYRSDIAVIDSRLRACTISHDEQALRECTEQFHRINTSHLEARGPRLEQIELVAASGAARGMAVELAEAVHRQTQIIESAQAELGHLQPELDVLTQCQQMLDEARQIAATAGQLDSTLDETLSEIHRIQGALEPDPLDRSTLGQLQHHSLNLEKLSHDTRD
jgi:hypothetical protein